MRGKKYLKIVNKPILDFGWVLLTLKKKKIVLLLVRYQKILFLRPGYLVKKSDIFYVVFSKQKRA